MNPKVTELLTSLRKRRAFDVDKYIEDKCKVINNFFRDETLDAVVVGVSGGIDSAVVYALLKEAKKQKDSPIKVVSPIFIPINGVGTTGQSEAEKRVYDWLKNDKGELYTLDGTDGFNGINEMFSAMFVLNKWTSGQIASIVRTPILYGYTALLQQQGYKSLVAGTTNRDEGGYIGFFGKASDMMVDVQPIADIHKSEVYQVAKKLGVSQEIIDSTPKGDVWDGRNDEQMIGASYDEIELFTLVKEYMTILSNDEVKNLNKQLADEHPRTSLYMAFSEIKKLHVINAHKYKVGMPCRFVDVMPRKVIGGWQ